MYLDQRVAHALAQRYLHLTLRDPMVMMETIRSTLAPIIARPVRPTTRDLKRMLEHRVVPAMRKLGLAPSVLIDGSRYVAQCHTFCASPSEGAADVGVRVDTQDMSIRTRRATVITPHAIARCLQRSRTDSFEKIFPELTTCLALGHTFAVVAYKHGWHQIGIPTPDGLFVGSFDRVSGTVNLQTYVRPGENGRSSKWEKYVDLVGPVFDFAAAQARDREDLAEWNQTFERRLLDETPFRSDTSFLYKPHTRAEDPDDSMWFSARAAAADFERQAAVA